MVRIFLFFLSINTLAAELTWEKFHEFEGISLYRALEKKSGLIPFKAEAIFEGQKEDYLKILLNHNEKNQWAPKLKSVVVHQRIDSNTFIFSEYYKTPWPAADREFLLRGHVEFPSENLIILRAENEKDLSYAKEEHIVCDVKVLNLYLEQIEKQKTKITFTFYGDMLGWMPIWLINIIQKKWPLRFLQGLRKYHAIGNIRESSEYLNLKR